MTDQHIAPQHNSNLPIVYDDVIELRLVVRSLWRGRWWIVGITIFGALIGLGINLLTTSYQSSGLFRTPGVSLNGYRIYSSALKNLPRWQRFTQLTGKQDSPVALHVGKIIANPDPSVFGKMVSPVFAITDTEAKNFDLKIDKTGTGMVGLDLTLEHDQKTTTAPLVLLADYVRSTMIRVDLRNTLQSACASHRSDALTLSNKKLQNAFAIQQNEQRRDTLTSILARLPASAKAEGQQVIALGKGNDRFLSPVTQLVGVDVAISDQKLAEVQADRDLVAAKLSADYYCKASDAFDKPKTTGQATLAQLDDIRRDTFADEDMENDVVRQTANSLQRQSDGWKNHYLEQVRFVASIEGAAVRVSKIGRLLAILLGLLGGLFLAVVLVLCVEWWGVNRDVILERQTE